MYDSASTSVPTHESPDLNDEVLDEILSKDALTKKHTDKEIFNMTIETLKGYGYTEDEVRKMVEDVSQIKDYFTIDSNNAASFDAESALEEGVDRELVLRTQKDMEKLDGINLLSSCSGISGWYAPQEIIFFDSCQTSNIIYSIETTGNITTIAGLIIAYFAPPAGIAVGIAGVLLNQGAAYLNHINRGYGIAVFYGRSPMEIHGQ